jgi:hypothetical protein
VPETVLGQLGNRVQHALRAFTPRDQKAVKTAADTLRPNPAIDIGRAITELAVGEALVSLLDAKGTPAITERAWIVPPASRIGPITDAERAAVRHATAASYRQYDQTVDRESAYEKLKARTMGKGQGGQVGQDDAARQSGPAASRGPTIAETLSSIFLGSTGPRGGVHDGLLQSAAKSAARSMGSGVGRAILRGALGSILGGRSR